MFDKFRVKVPVQPGGGEGLEKRKGVVARGSERSVDQKREAIAAKARGEPKLRFGILFVCPSKKCSFVVGC